MFPVRVTYVSTGALRASVTVLIRPVADGPVNWAKAVDDSNKKPINKDTEIFIRFLSFLAFGMKGARKFIDGFLFFVRPNVKHHRQQKNRATKERRFFCPSACVC